MMCWLAAGLFSALTSALGREEEAEGDDDDVLVSS